MDRHVFKDHDFLPADTTDNVLIEPPANATDNVLIVPPADPTDNVLVEPPANNTVNVLAEQKRQQNLTDRDNATPDIAKSPSLLQYAWEDPLQKTPPPILDSQAEEVPADTPPILEPRTISLESVSPINRSTLNQDVNISTQITPATVTPPTFDPYLNPQPSTSFAISPCNLFPIPKALPKTRNVNRKRGRTVILTSSPYKNELQEEKIQQEQKKATKRVKKAIIEPTPKTNQPKNLKLKSKNVARTMLKRKVTNILTTMMTQMMTLNAFTVAKFGLNQNMKMVGYSVLFVSDAPMKRARVVMTTMITFIGNFVPKNIFYYDYE